MIIVFLSLLFLCAIATFLFGLSGFLISFGLIVVFIWALLY